jgi:hypothetical protein
VEVVPPNLYLQLDNTAKQNKSQYLFAALGFLVWKRTFVTITTSFLPVGHTHDDVDQMFSRFSIAYRQSDALCVEEAVDLLEKVQSLC